MSILIKDIDGPFDASGTKVEEIQLGERYNYFATPNELITAEDLNKVHWAYKYDSDKLTTFNHANTAIEDGKVHMSCIFHKNPSKVAVYAYCNSPSPTVCIETIVQQNEVIPDSQDDDSSDTTDHDANDPALSPTSKINHSVGDNAKNDPEDVLLVKTLLNKFGCGLNLTSDADESLVEAIKDFQRDYKGSNHPDGRIDVNKSTWNSLLGVARIIGILPKVSRIYGVEPAVILSIQSIESRGNGFLQDGRPKILFEGHVFWKRLKKAGKDPNKLSVGNEDILYTPRDKSKYKGGAHEYPRLARAKEIDHKCALESASWGAFQIMGFNHKVVGYDNVDAFVEAMHKVGEYQLKAVMEFLKTNHLIKHVSGETKNWTALARGYNGAGQEGYDTKLEKNYKLFSKLNL
jgi:N-acetylmuramidase/Putative peptidoglycan binding domain